MGGFLFGTAWRSRNLRGVWWWVWGRGTPNPRYCIFIFLCSQHGGLGARGVRPPHPEHEIQITWRAPVCCQVADFAGQPMSRHRAIGSWTKLRRLPPDVRVSCQVVTIAPQWPRRLCGLSRHRAIGSWTNAWSRRQWAKLRRSHPDVRVGCQVVAIAPQWPRRQCGRRVLSRGRRPSSRENRVTSALSRRSWPRTAGRTLVQTAGCGSCVCQPAERSTERGGER